MSRCVLQPCIMCKSRPRRLDQMPIPIAELTDEHGYTRIGAGRYCSYECEEAAKVSHDIDVAFS